MASISTPTSGSPKRSRPPRAALSLSPPPPARPDPPPASDADGRVLVELKTMWARWNVSLPLRAHRILGEARSHHPSTRGELAFCITASSPPHARWRSQVVSYGRPSPESTARQFDASPRAAGSPGGVDLGFPDAPRVRSRVSSPCPRCGGRLARPRHRPGTPRRAGLPSPTLPAPAPPRRPAPPHPRPPHSCSPRLSSALDPAPDSRRRTPLPAP
jgi:hypothetical protein